MWFTTEFLISKPKLCLHHNGTYQFTQLLRAFFPTVLPHRAGPEQSWTPFSGALWECIMLLQDTAIPHSQGTLVGPKYFSRHCCQKHWSHCDKTWPELPSQGENTGHCPFTWAEAGGIPQVIKSLPQLSSHQTRLLHSVSSSDFLIELLSFMGIRLFKCKKPKVDTGKKGKVFWEATN